MILFQVPSENTFQAIFLTSLICRNFQRSKTQKKKTKKTEHVQKLIDSCTQHLQSADQVSDP